MSSVDGEPQRSRLYDLGAAFLSSIAPILLSGTSFPPIFLQLDADDDILNETSAATVKLDRDVKCFYLMVTFVRPQVCFRGPYSRQAVTLTAASGEMTQHMHEMVYRRGQFSCKESFIGAFDGLQYFLSNDQTPVVWVPDDMTHRKGFVVSRHSPNLFRAAHPCKYICTYVSFFHDGEAVRRERGNGK